MMRAYLSNPDSGVRGLRPDLYEADRAWIAKTQRDEAARILADVEPANVQPTCTAADPRHALDHTPDHIWSARCEVSVMALGALAETLAAFVGVR